MSTTDDDSDKTLVIRGSNINIQHAELEIKKLILDMPMVLVEEYYVPDYACGKIIGTSFPFSFLFFFIEFQHLENFLKYLIDVKL